LESNLYEYGAILGESKIHIKSDNEKAILQAVEEIKRHRKELLDYIQIHPEFQHILRPIEVVDNVPEIVRRMMESSKIADVGPMASVAGALADLGLRSMLKHGAKVAVVENGGEIAIYTERPISVTILSSNLNLSGKIGFYITRKDCPLGIATSSSKTGHAISFGEADSVTVVAENASLADAAATAVCNFVSGGDIEASIQRGLRRGFKIPGVKGILIIRESRVGMAGRLPQIIKVKG